jgi:hypothetical protein
VATLSAIIISDRLKYFMRCVLELSHTDNTAPTRTNRFDGGA